MRLEIRNVSKSYRRGKVKALDDFSLFLTPGVYGLLGPNGAGKTTLMNIIVDNLLADRGTILYDGEDTRAMGRRFREILGYMPQQQGLYESFTANRFLWYMAALKGIDRAVAGKRISQLMDLVNLREDAHKKLGTFSGGMTSSFKRSPNFNSRRADRWAGSQGKGADSKFYQRNCAG